MSKKRDHADDDEVSGKRVRVEEDDKIKQAVLEAMALMEERQAEKDRKNSFVGVLNSIVGFVRNASTSLVSNDSVSPIQDRLVSFFGDVMQPEYSREVVDMVLSYPDAFEKYTITFGHTHRVRCDTLRDFAKTDGIAGARVNLDPVTKAQIFEFYHTQNPKALAAYARSNAPVMANLVSLPARPGETAIETASRLVIDRVNRYVTIKNRVGEAYERCVDGHMRLCVSVSVEVPVKTESLNFALEGKIVADALFYKQENSDSLCMLLETALP